MLFTTSKNKHKMLRWFTNLTDAEKYSKDLYRFENRDCYVKQISNNRFEVYEIPINY